MNDLESQVAELQQQVAYLQREIGRLVRSDHYEFEKRIQVFDGIKMRFGGTSGTMIGTTATEKLAFFGATPVVRQAAITPPSGGTTVDTQARIAINSLITNNQTFGLTS